MCIYICVHIYIFHDCWYILGKNCFLSRQLFCNTIRKINRKQRNNLVVIDIINKIQEKVRIESKMED